MRVPRALNVDVPNALDSSALSFRPSRDDPNRIDLEAFPLQKSSHDPFGVLRERESRALGWFQLYVEIVVNPGVFCQSHRAG